MSSHADENAYCRECGGSQICPHSRRKAYCKKCSDPIKINIEQWIFSSRQYDKMRNIYDADRFIDKCFLEGLVEDYKQCYYGDCKVILTIYRISKMILRQSRDLIIRLGISRATVFCAAMKCNLSKMSKKSSAHELN